MTHDLILWPAGNDTTRAECACTWQGRRHDTTGQATAEHWAHWEGA